MTSNKTRDPWKALADTASKQHGVFHRQDARDVGVSHRRLRTAVSQKRLRRPLSDVFVFASHPDMFRQRCAVATVAGGVISHESSAVIHRFDGFNERDHAEIHVCFPRDHKRVMPSGYVVHTWRHTRASDIVSIDGISCTSIARTLSQLGLNQPRAVVEAALDSALRNGASARWIEQTHTELRRPGPTGQYVFDEITADPERSGVLTESVLEDIVERVLRDASLPKPVRQHEVRVESGTRRFDFAFPRAKLGVEAHSRRHHWGAPAETRDNVRDLELAAEGWEVLYITWGMAHEPALFLRLLRQTYLQRCKLLAAPPASGF